MRILTTGLKYSELSDDQKTAATEQFESDVIRAIGDGKDAAYLAARDFEFACRSPFQDWWKVDTDDYSFRFLWCCYALAWGVQKYDEARLSKIFDAARTELSGTLSDPAGSGP